jgi:hypothetical protein
MVYHRINQPAYTLFIEQILIIKPSVQLNIRYSYKLNK